MLLSSSGQPSMNFLPPLLKILCLLGPRWVWLKAFQVCGGEMDRLNLLHSSAARKPVSCLWWAVAAEKPKIIKAFCSDVVFLLTAQPEGWNEEDSSHLTGRAAEAELELEPRSPVFSSCFTPFSGLISTHLENLRFQCVASGEHSDTFRITITPPNSTP